MWQTWQALCLCVLWWSSLKFMFSGLVQKDLFKGGVKFGGNVFQTELLSRLSHKDCRLHSYPVLSRTFTNKKLRELLTTILFSKRASLNLSEMRVLLVWGLEWVLRWSGRLGRGDARVDAFLAFVVCASFGKKPVSRSASNGTDYFHWSSQGMIIEIKAPRRSFLKNTLNMYSCITDWIGFWSC